MSITITDTTMASTTIPVWARYSPHAAADGKGAWLVSWIPERLFDRDRAVMALKLAEHVAAVGHVQSATTEVAAAELQLSVPEVLRRLGPLLDQISATRGV